MNMLDLFERRMLKLRKEAKLGLFACQPCLYPTFVCMELKEVFAWQKLLWYKHVWSYRQKQRRYCLEVVACDLSEYAPQQANITLHNELFVRMETESNPM
jgi:hypothetical protein